MADVLKILER